MIKYKLKNEKPLPNIDSINIINFSLRSQNNALTLHLNFSTRCFELEINGGYSPYLVEWQKEDNRVYETVLGWPKSNLSGKMRRNNNILLFIICLICLNSCNSNSPKENKDNIIAVSKIASDNGEDSLYVETLLKAEHEKLPEFEKKYNKLFYYSKRISKKLILDITKDRISEIISIFEFENKLSIIYLGYGGSLRFKSYVFDNRQYCKEENTWCLIYDSGLNMSGQYGIKKVVWIEPIIIYVEPLYHKKPNLILALIGNNLRTVAKDEEIVNNKYFDYKQPLYPNNFSKYFSNKSWEGTDYYKYEYDKEFKEYIRKNVKKN